MASQRLRLALTDRGPCNLHSPTVSQEHLQHTNERAWRNVQGRSSRPLSRRLQVRSRMSCRTGGPQGGRAENDESKAVRTWPSGFKAASWSARSPHSQSNPAGSARHRRGTSKPIAIRRPMKGTAQARREQDPVGAVTGRVPAWRPVRHACGAPSRSAAPKSRHRTWTGGSEPNGGRPGLAHISASSRRTIGRLPARVRRAR